MEIIPKLNLNRNPKDIPSGSLVAAKNMIIDDTGSYFTNEYGFKVTFDCENEGEYVCGVIPCVNEIVIFTYQHINNKSRIYRKKDGYDAIEIATNWQYNNGDIRGTYTYNYKGELIIVVSEINAKDANDNEIKVPLKCWNLDDANNNLLHSIEEIVPKTEVDYSIVNGALNCGVYTFFIRYKIDEDNYTKWFQITDDIIIINNDSHNAPIHNFLVSDAGSVTKYNKDHDEYFPTFQINGNKKSNKGICLSINVDNDDFKFDEYQIGYIVKHDEEVLGRIFNSYNINISTVLFVENNYIEEESIDEFIKNPTQYYNVRNLINYNNRLYISGYEEYINNDLNFYAKKVKCRVSIKDAKTASSNKTISVKTLSISTTFKTTGGNTYTDTWDKFTKNSDGTYIIDNNYKDEFIRKFFASVIRLYRFGESYSVEKNKIENNPAGYGKEPFRVIDVHTIYVSPKNYNKQYAIYDSNIQKAINIDSIKINNDGYIVLYINGDEIIVGNGKSDFNILIEESQAFSSGTTKVVAFYLEPLQYNPPYHYQTGYGMSSQVVLIDTIYDLSVESPYNNYKSLIPGQVYAFYIHYIRKDGSATNGFLIENDCDKDNNVATENGYFDLFINNISNRLFRTPNPTVEDTLIFAKFEVPDIPDDYIGYFMSYEKVEDNVYSTVALETEGVTNTALQYNIDSIQGVYYFDIIGKAPSIERKSSIGTINNIIETTIHPYCFFTNNKKFDFKKLIGVYTENKNIYSKSVKTLYRFTDNYYVKRNTSNSYKYIPSFYNKEKIVMYNKKLIINPTASYAVTPNSEKLNDYDIKLIEVNNYSKYPYNACNIKQDYNEGAVSLVDKDNKTLGVYYNKVLSPDRLRNFIEIKQAYISAPNKVYTNYSRKYSDKFNKTIRRSNVISDESLTNGFRKFEDEEYKIIKENKGDIVNLVGIGFYLLVHTEYSLFVFDRSPHLTTKSQLQIPDTFDIDYQEVLPSNEGFGGLRNADESIVTKNGYIWFDYNNNIIFKYENGKASVLSSDINNFIKDLNIDSVRFGEDLLSNRLLICIYVKVNNDKYAITLSYNFNTNTFISMHDYSFTNCYRTYKKAYYFDSNKDKGRLYEFDKSSNKYYNLINNTTLYYPKYE